jgi:hypothetical protein
VTNRRPYIPGYDYSSALETDYIEEGFIQVFTAKGRRNYQCKRIAEHARDFNRIKRRLRDSSRLEWRMG